MLKEMLLFYWGLISRYSWRPVWMDSRDPDSDHFHRRRFTQAYRRRQKLVEKIWLVLGAGLCLFPSLPLVGVALLLGTFISFCILDET